MIEHPKNCPYRTGKGFSGVEHQAKRLRMGLFERVSQLGTCFVSRCKTFGTEVWDPELESGRVAMSVGEKAIPVTMCKSNKQYTKTRYLSAEKPDIGSIEGDWILGACH